MLPPLNVLVTFNNNGLLYIAAQCWIVHKTLKHWNNNVRYSTLQNHRAPFTGQLKVNSALHPSGVAKSSTSFGWGKGGKVSSAGWQVTLCDFIWHVISRSGVIISITNCYIRFTLLYFTLLTFDLW